jgi:hypothetical protein
MSMDEHNVGNLNATNFFRFGRSTKKT